MAVHEYEVCTAPIAVAGGVVKGRVVVDLAALVADGEVCIVERGDTVALNRPGVLLGEDDDAGGAVHLRLLGDAGHIRTQPIGPDRAFSTHVGVHDVADGSVGISSGRTAKMAKQDGSMRHYYR